MPVLSTARAHRRPLATTVLAAGALFAVWFVPSSDTAPEPGPASVSAGEMQAARASAADDREHGAAGERAARGARREAHDPARDRAEGTDRAGRTDRTEGRGEAARPPLQPVLAAGDDGSGTTPYLLVGIGLAGAAAAGGAALTRARTR